MILVVVCMPIVPAVPLVGQAPLSDNLDNYETLFPLSYYGQALSICMRVLTDSKYNYDTETAADLCVGRLYRLASAVLQMEHCHMTQNRYPFEDIVYMLGLLGAVYKERQEAIRSNKVASCLLSSIEGRLALLLRNP